MANIKHRMPFNVIRNGKRIKKIEFNPRKHENTGKHRQIYFNANLIVPTTSSLFCCARSINEM